MDAPKSFREFKARQKAKMKLKPKSTIDKLILDLKSNPDQFLLDYKKELPIITSQEYPELKNLHEENLITLFIDTCQTNPDINNIYNEFMNLSSKGFLTINKRNETFLFELSRRDNLKLFLETLIKLDNLKLLTNELLLCKNNDSENCFNIILKSINTTNNKKI